MDRGNGRDSSGDQGAPDLQSLFVVVIAFLSAIVDVLGYAPGMFATQ